MSTHPHLRTADDACLIALEGQVDDETIEALQGRIATALAGGRARIVVDLSEVTGLSLPSLSRLCRALRRAARAGATVAVGGGPPHARRTIGLCAIEGVELSVDRPPDDSETFPQ